VTASELVPLRRNVSFHLLWTGAALSTVGTQMSALAYPLLILAVTRSPAAAGLASGAQLTGLVLLGLPAGPLVDRWDRRRILVGCEAVCAAGTASVALAAVTGRVTLAHLLAVALVQGGATALFNPARFVALRAVVPASQLRTALAREEARIHAAALVGPPLGAALFGTAAALPFLADAVSYLASLVCVLAARVPRRPLSTVGCTRPALARDFVAGLRWLRGQPLLYAVCGFSMVLNLALGGLLVSVIVLIRDRGGSAGLIGAVVAAMGAGGLAGAFLAAPLGRRLPAGRLVRMAAWVLAGLFLAVPLPLGRLWPGLVLALIVLVPPVVSVSVQASVLADTPDRLRGRIGSLLMVASLGVAPLGPLTGGLTTQLLGPVAALLLLGLLLATTALALSRTRALADRVGSGAASQRSEDAGPPPRPVPAG
jgi:MFS family permease